MRLILLIVAATLGLPALAWAGSGDDLMKRFDAAMVTTGERTTVHLTRTVQGGATREADFVMTQLIPADDAARSKIVFTSPSDVAGTAVLSVEHEGKRSQWVYLPEVAMTRKLANADRTESFANTDFTLEDLRIRSDFVNRNYELVGTAEVEGNTCQIVEDTAANDKEQKYSGYSKVLMYIEEERMLMWKVEFFDKQGQLQKVLTAHDLEQFGEQWKHNTAKMTHLLDGSTTVFAGQREVGLAVSKADFSPSLLGE